MPDSLVRPLFDGAIDVVGDVHGEIDALQTLLDLLGYRPDGVHPEGRRLVFVGDLVDRGPDSPNVVDLVARFVAEGTAQCVLGNHEFNLLMKDKKPDNRWYFGDQASLDKSDEITPAVLADEEGRKRMKDFFQTLPLVLVRDDVRVVHACWNKPMVREALDADSAKGLYSRFRDEIDRRQEGKIELDEIERGLEHQNLNPVKVLVSGPEHRVKKPFEAGGKMRHEKRTEWWKKYDANEYCFFGHYSNDRGKYDLKSRAICVDFSVGKRWEERKRKGFNGTFSNLLAAARLPERQIIYDNGDRESFG